MWAMVYFRELPVPLKGINTDFLEIFFNFANTYTEETILQSFIKNRQEAESRPTVQVMKRMGYSEEDIANMDLRDGG
jgi:hypothetical protein